MRIDLHTHTHHSDGRLSAQLLFERAAAEGLTHLAVTDHDTVAGLAPAAQAAARTGLVLVCGIEMTAQLHGREVHLLGHGLVPTAPALAALAQRAGADRRARLERMVERLARQGLAVPLQEVLDEAAGAMPGRPHLARVLARRGLVESVQQAFDAYLSPGMPGWVDRPRPEARDATALLHSCGAVAVLAHPGVNHVSRVELRDLAAAGLDGVEAFHPDHPPSQEEAYVRWARESGLSCTGGSDFHGDGDGDHPSRPGLRTTPPDEYARLAGIWERRQQTEALAAALAAWRQSCSGASGKAAPPPARPGS